MSCAPVEFKGALDHLEFYMLEPRAQRLFAACDLAKTGKITIMCVGQTDRRMTSAKAPPSL